MIISIIIITLILIVIIGRIYDIKTKIIEYLANYISKIVNENNFKRRPKRIILIRHGESEANINPKIYKTIPDSKISLTNNGKEDARKVGEELKKLIKDESIFFYISPYVRTKQTFEIIKDCLNIKNFEYQIHPLLREQEYGNFHFFEEHTFKELKEVGKFYYRFDNGESCADVYIRATLFLDFIFRQIRDIRISNKDNIVIVCHDLFMRVFAMNFLNLDVDSFEKIRKPKNCEMWIIEKGKYHYEIKTNVFVN